MNPDCPRCGGPLDPVIEKLPLQPVQTWLECRDCGTAFDWEDAELMDAEEA